MTVEAALAKMMIGLGRYASLGELRAWLEQRRRRRARGLGRSPPEGCPP